MGKHTVLSVPEIIADWPAQSACAVATEEKKKEEEKEGRKAREAEWTCGGSGRTTSWRKDEGSNLQWLRKNNYHSAKD